MERRPVLAVAFALLMLASSVTMSGAAAAFGDSHDSLELSEPAVTYQQPALTGPAQTGGTSNDTADPGLPSITDPRLNPHQRVAIANLTLHDVEGENRRQERALSQARDRVETALDHYEAGRATDRRAFHAQARALQALARATGGSHDPTIRNVSEGLFVASNESARIAIRDANGSLRTYADDLDRNERRFVENALRNAEAGFDRADRMAEPRGRGNGRNSLRRQVQSKANAIGHYRYAFNHAGRAMDRMERAVDPQLSLSQGQAFERNGSVHVVLGASLTDVRPYAYDEATVSVTNGSANASAIRFRRAIPGSSATSGSTIVDLGPDAENVTLAVSANASHDEDRTVEETIHVSVDDVEVIPDPPDPDEYNEVEIRNESTGVTVEADGDGLWEERMRITNETPASDQAFRAAPVVRVESQSEIDNATIRIPIDESVPRSQYENLSVYTWNGSQGSQWHRVNTTIENGTAVAQVEHFSFFTVLDDFPWHDSITETVSVDNATATEPIAFESLSEFTCSDPCGVSNSTTLHLGGSPNNSATSESGGDVAGSFARSSGEAPISREVQSAENDTFAGGSGTTDDPYQIATLEQLQRIESAKNAHYVLVSDINAASTQEWNDGRGFDPIGTRSNPFTGSLDGQGHTIDSLHIDRPTVYVGLVGYSNNARFEEIRLENWSVAGNYDVGTLVGWGGDNLRVDAVRNSGSTVSGNGAVGGLIGNYDDGAEITNSHSSGSVRGNLDVGGLSGGAGSNWVISNTSVVGDVSGEYIVGGMVGGGWEGWEIRNSSVEGDITGFGSVGGLVASNVGDWSISNSHVDGNIRSSKYGDVGGLVGDGSDSWSVADSTFQGSVHSGGDEVGGLVGAVYGTGSAVSNSSAVGNVSSDGSRVGGLLGESGKNLEIQSSFYRGNVTADGENVGGLIGQSDSGTEISDSYARGSARAANYVGGIIGDQDGGASISRSYAAVSLAANGDSVGVLYGDESGSFTVQNSYWDVNVTGIGQSDAGIGLETQAMTGEAAAENLDGFDFANTWITTDEYPTLAWVNATGPTASTASWTVDANDTVSHYSIQYRVLEPSQPNGTVTVTGENGSAISEPLALSNESRERVTLNVSELSGDLDFDIEAEDAELELQFVELNTYVDSDKDGLPDALEERRWTMPVGSFQNITTDQYDADTDGDGLEDGEEIDFRIENETEEGTVYRIRAWSNPALVDSDYDGLPDDVEERGWEIQYTDSREDSIELQEALAESSEDEVPDLDPYLTTRNVTSNPLLEDSNGDGLSDPENRELGTNPLSADTTGDGVGDAESSEYGRDPTLFEFRPPEIEVQDADIYSDTWETDVNYYAWVEVTAPAGVQSISLVVDGDVEDSDEPNGQRNRIVLLEGSDGGLDNALGFYLGQSMSVRATDVHENSAEAPGDRRNSIFADVSTELAGAGLGSDAVAYYMGSFQGMATGGGETIGFVRMVLTTHPRQTLGQFADAIEQIDNIDQIIESLPAAIEQQQHQQNPHPESSSEYETFRYGWYRGYIAYYVLESFIPASKAKDVVSNSNRLRRAFDELDRSGQLTRIAQRASRTYDTATGPARFAQTHIVRGARAGAGYSREAATQVIGAGRTTAQKYRIAEQLRRFDPRTIERLSPDEQSRLGQFLARYGDDGGRLMADGGEDLRRLIVRSDGLDEDTTRALLRAHARGDVSDTELRRISNALDEGGLTQAEVRRALNRLHRLVSDGAIENPRIRLGTDANFRDPYYTVRYADDFDRTDLVNGEVPDDFRPGDSTPGYDPPHDPQGLVIEGRTSSPQDWVRVHTPDNQVGTFLMNSEEFASVAAEAGETGLRRRFALPGEYSRVSRVEVPEGAQVRVSTVGRQADDLPGGGTQIELRRYPEELPGDWFNEPKDIDRYVSEHQ